MVSKEAWDRYLEIASLMKESDRDEALLMLNILLGDLRETSAGSVVVYAGDDLEFWVRSHGISDLVVEYSHDCCVIKQSIQGLRDALVRQNLLEIG